MIQATLIECLQMLLVEVLIDEIKYPTKTKNFQNPMLLKIY
jgi:hypothetical protein